MDRDEARILLQSLIDRHGEDYAGLSRMIGRNPAYIQQYIKRGTPRRLAEEDRRVLAGYFGIDERLLGGPEQAAPPQTDAGERSRHGQLQAIPRLDVGASAGHGAWAEREHASGAIAFDPGWLKAMGLKADRLSLIRVEGDSMAPTLNDGDEIMVERLGPLRGATRDGIHVIRMDGTLMVKRLARAPGGRLSVLSDNSAYRDWPDCDPAQVEVIGRVVWMGRRL